MDDGFAAAVAAWHDFYLLAGTAAATLIGLIFVALSLNPEVMADDGRSASGPGRGKRSAAS